MVEVSVDVELAASPPRVWLLVSDFHGLCHWHPSVVHSASERGGHRRRLTLEDGTQALEELSAFSAAERSYSYRMVEGPLPVRDYAAMLTVRERSGGRGSRVEWTGRFEPVGDADPEELRETLVGLYRAGLDGLVGRFGDPEPLERGRAPA